MRPLSEEETKIFFSKLSKYIGRNILLLVDRKDGNYCFRINQQKVYYCEEKIMKDGVSVSRDKLLSIGTCFGKFTKTLKFRLQITCLDVLSQFAKYKVSVRVYSLGIRTILTAK